MHGTIGASRSTNFSFKKDFVKDSMVVLGPERTFKLRNPLVQSTSIGLHQQNSGLLQAIDDGSASLHGPSTSPFDTTKKIRLVSWQIISRLLFSRRPVETNRNNREQIHNKQRVQESGLIISPCQRGKPKKNNMERFQSFCFLQLTSRNSYNTRLFQSNGSLGPFWYADTTRRVKEKNKRTTEHYPFIQLVTFWKSCRPFFIQRAQTKMRKKCSSYYRGLFFSI